MTPEQATDISNQFNSFIKTYEAIYAPKFNKALKIQHQQYIESGTISAIDSTLIYKVLIQVYENSAAVWAHKSMIITRSMKARQPMGFSRRIAELMKKYFGIDLLNIAEQITNTTKKIIGEVLSRATESGASFNDIVDELESPELTRNRSRLIARTEVMRSANGAAYINAKEQAAITGAILKKIWIDTHDSRVRHDHQEVGGHIIGIDDYFIVGGFKMLYPGDSSHGADASEICRCRCCNGFIVA